MKTDKQIIEDVLFRAGLAYRGNEFDSNRIICHGAEFRFNANDELIDIQAEEFEDDDY